MTKLFLPAVFLALFVLACATSRALVVEGPVASRVLASFVASGVASTAETRAEAARAFLASLEEDERAACALDLADPERQRWTNVPSRAGDGGVRLGDLDAHELELACGLLSVVLSPTGFAKVRDVMLADDRLLRNGAPRTGFGTEEFRIVVFGEPAAQNAWALQLDGHHVGLNLTFVGEQITQSPTFVGAQPSSYQRGDRVVVPLARELAAGFALVNALTDEQRALAVLSPSRGRIAAGAGRDGVVPAPQGLAATELDAAQRRLLLNLVEAYVGDLPAPQATARLRAIEAELDDVSFAWHGPLDEPSDVSYRVQGPSFLIEFACQDLGGDPLDHLHSIVRDLDNEYGVAWTADASLPKPR